MQWHGMEQKKGGKLTSLRTSRLIWSAITVGSITPAFTLANSAMPVAILELEKVQSQHLDSRT